MCFQKKQLIFVFHSMRLIMIQSFDIDNFKSYSQANFKLAPLTVLIGANASGKSNALEAIRFISWLANGQKLSSLQYNVNKDEQIVRGHIKDILKFGSEKFTIGCKLSDDDHSSLSVSIEFRNEEELHICKEVCSTYDVFLYQTVRPSIGTSIDIKVEYNNFLKTGGKKPQITCTDQQGIFTQLGSSAPFAESNERVKKYIPRIASSFEKALVNILFLDPVPNRMRDYSFISDKVLSGDGRNISSVLFHLVNSPKVEKLELLEFIKSLPEQNISAIDFLRGPRQEVMVQLVETFGNIERKMDASLLSDGTLRVLAIAAALLSAPEGSLVIVEEIDNGVHPSRAKQLLDSIYRVANKRKLKILISSHNPALLNALPYEAIPSVVFCYRDKIDGASKLISLEDVPNYPELVSQGSLGNLLTQGLFDRFVKNMDNDGNKKEKALNWLKNLQNMEAV
jgi:predicted ATPase